MWTWVVVLHYPDWYAINGQFDTEEEAEHHLRVLVKNKATGFIYGTIERRAYANQ